MGMKERLNKLIGNLPVESGFKKQMRFHQAWWRTFVLVEEPGFHPIRKNEMIGSAILNGQFDYKNFLSKSIVDSV